MTDRRAYKIEYLLSHRKVLPSVAFCMAFFTFIALASPPIEASAQTQSKSAQKHVAGSEAALIKAKIQNAKNELSLVRGELKLNGTTDQFKTQLQFRETQLTEEISKLEKQLAGKP